MISIVPRGADLGAVTRETRWAAELAAIGGYITQVWTWRGGEAVVLREWSRYGAGRWSVVVRRGLRRGVPRLIPAGSIAAALTALGVAYRIRSVRRPPTMPDPFSPAGRRRRLVPGVHRRGNTWRTLRASRRSGRDRSAPIGANKQLTPTE
jgi:hypothetical protein